MIHSSRVESFWKKVDVKKDDECWLWKGAINADGYGTYNQHGANSKTLLCHRISYQLSFGELPDTHFVRHSCNNRHCVNPAHLVVSTSRCAHSSNKLDSEKVAEIKLLISQGVSQSKIARDFGVSRQLIFQIKEGTAWANA